MGAFEKSLHFAELVRVNKRISIRRLAEEMEVSERQAYRYVQKASLHMPIRLESGIVIYQKPPH